MKTHEEMYESVLRRRDEYEARQAASRPIKRRVISVACVALACCIGLGAYGVSRSAGFQPNRSVSSGGTIRLTPFAASGTKDSWIDRYGEDELPNPEVTVNGVGYRQLKPEEYETYAITEELPATALGACLGTVREIVTGDETDNITSKEPALKDAAVYSYAGRPAVLVLQKEERYSVFVHDQLLSAQKEYAASFEDSYRFFGVTSAEDLAGLTVRVSRWENNVAVETRIQVDDRERLAAFYDLTLALAPERVRGNLEGSPDWIVQGWDDYRSNPEGYEYEYILIDIRLTSGDVIRDIAYLPFIGNGCVSDMQQLTPEQNAALRSLLR